LVKKKNQSTFNDPVQVFVLEKSSQEEREEKVAHACNPTQEVEIRRTAI
jgi:hypothetical protein